MNFAVFKPVFEKTGEHITQRGERAFYWFEVDMAPARTLVATNASDAIREAKALGHVAPIVGEVA